MERHPCEVTWLEWGQGRCGCPGYARWPLVCVDRPVHQEMQVHCVFVKKSRQPVLFMYQTEPKSMGCFLESTQLGRSCCKWQTNSAQKLDYMHIQCSILDIFKDLLSCPLQHLRDGVICTTRGHICRYPRGMPNTGPSPTKQFWAILWEQDLHWLRFIFVHMDLLTINCGSIWFLSLSLCPLVFILILLWTTTTTLAINSMGQWQPQVRTNSRGNTWTWGSHWPEAIL